MRRKGAICHFDVNKKRNASKRSKELKIGFKFSPPNLAKTCTQKTENGHIHKYGYKIVRTNFLWVLNFGQVGGPNKKNQKHPLGWIFLKSY